MPSAEDAERAKRVRRWRARAEDLRATLQSMKHPFARQVMQGLADDYDHMADLAERGAEEPAKREAG